VEGPGTGYPAAFPEEVPMIRWHESWESAVAAAKETKRPIFLWLHAPT
jgi:hypothetical protein